MARKPKPKKRKIRIYDAGFGNDWINLDPPMGYIFDTKVKIPATANTTTNANPATGTITIADDADLLIVAMIYGGNAARTGGAPTANGTSLTQADAARTVTEAVAELWYLTAPSPGANVIVVPNIPTAKNLDIFVASFKAQPGYNSVFSSASGSATTAANPNITLRIPDTQSVVVSVVGHGANAWGPTSQSGTVIYNEDPSTWGGGSQFILNAPIGAVISAWTQASDDYGIVAVAFIEQQILKSVLDVGYGIDQETKTITALSKSIVDTGLGSDAVSNLTKQKFVSITDTGQGSDALSGLSQSRSVTEIGKGTDNSQIGAFISVSDVIYGLDSISRNIIISVSEAGTITESLTKQVFISISDTANAVYSGIGAEFPITPILDDFNRNSGSMGDNWTYPIEGDNPSIVINDNKAYADGNYSEGKWLIWYKIPLEVYLDMPLTDTIYRTILFCIQSIYPNRTFYGLSLVYLPSKSLSYTLYRYDNGSFMGNLLINDNFETGNIDSFEKIGIRILLDGTITIYGRWNGEEWKYIDSYIDIFPLLEGYAGFALDIGGYADNFGGGNLTYMDIPIISADLSIGDVGLSADIGEVGVEYLYPISDIENIGSWKNELGGSILYTSIDELIDPNDNDYVWIVDANVNDYFEVGLSVPQYLFDDGDVVIHWRGANHNLGVNTTIKVELREGNTVIASDEQNLSDSFITYEYALTAEEVANIVDPSNLSIRFTVTGVS